MTTMRSRAFVFTWWIFIAIVISEMEPRDLDSDLFDYTSLDIASVEGMNPVLSERSNRIQNFRADISDLGLHG